MMNELVNADNPPINFPTDHSSIIERINQIDPVQYGKSRNFVDGSVTYLSPYLSRGVITVSQVRDSILGKSHEHEKLLQELAWREYFQRVWQTKGDAMFEDIRQLQSDVMHCMMIGSVLNANTGIVAIDDAISKLYKTGYMHNHLRMYVASMTCNIGKAHWSTPARWMYYHLLDGDLASNTCSWQWVAGTFSSKKYYCNQENINHFTHSDQANTFLDVSSEQLLSISCPPSLAATVELELITNLPNVQQPFIDVTRPTLIYNSYNIDPNWRRTENVNRILLLEPSHFRKYPVSNKVLSFIMDLGRNIPHCQIMIGEVSELEQLYLNSTLGINGLISKEHPASTYYPGIRDQREWIYSDITGYFPSFSSFWKKVRKASR